MSEFGFYGQIGTVGIAFGYDTENGITGSVFASVSAVVTVDSWTSLSTRGGFEGSTGGSVAKFHGWFLFRPGRGISFCKELQAGTLHGH